MTKEKKSFEDNLTELEDIVLALENGNLPLDEAINYYTKAMTLAKECSNRLDQATKQINQILEDGQLKEFKIEDGEINE